MQLFEPNMRFYKGNTHAHSTQSDGRLSPEEVFETYHSAGYDFLALTDHWVLTDEQDYRGMLVIPGVAVVITALAINLFGDGLRDALDPKSLK